MNGPAQPIRTLEKRFYLAPEIYRREQQGVLARTWQFACHASQVRNIGDYFSFFVAGENLFCLRGKDGKVRAFYNVCQHRAHELVSGMGSVRSIVCPYHAWTYELDGRLRGGPNLRSVPNLEISDIRLAEVRIEDFHGFLFVNLDRNAAPMNDWFPGVRDELLEFVPHVADLEPLEWIKVFEKCNWKLSVENYSECYHCTINHKTFATGVVEPKSYDIQPQGYCLRHTTRCQNLDRMSYTVDLEANSRAGEYSSWYLWPMFSFQVYPGNVLNTYHWRPTDHCGVDVVRGWYTVRGRDSTTIRRLAVQDRETTLEEDIHLVESVQRGLASRGYRPGPLVVDPSGGLNSEHSIRVLQQWMREGIEDSAENSEGVDSVARQHSAMEDPQSVPGTHN
ncbi:MAG: aromatic ring-hydroxylating dioxygenase subunit alpha [Rhodobacteraceae bacterium]|nr:aromatic ring-hydroxylating dioxygenase subunit alpha [Paracoccaceae bacterium]